MELAGALGFASAIVAFLELSAEVAQRLEELSNVGDVPEAFRDANTRLPLISSILTSFQGSPENFPSDVQKSVNRIVTDCHGLVQQLQKIIDKVTVKEGDSRWRRGFKAIVSFSEEGRLQQISLTLRDHIQILTSFNTTTVNNERGPRRPSLSQHLSAEAPAYSQNDYLWIVPFDRDNQFIGRSKILEDIDTIFQQQRRLSIAGMGGIGKSQVAIEYAYRFRDANPGAHVFWVYGATPARFYQGYKEIAQQLRLPSWDDPDVDMLNLMLDWFNNTSSRFLLILDNADNMNYYYPSRDDPEKADVPTTNLAAYLPMHRGNILITSRDLRVAKRLMRTNNPILLQAFSQEEAEQLFISQSSSDDKQLDQAAVTKLVEGLDYLPLAISQAASFISESGISLDEYLTSLQGSDPVELLREEVDDFRRDEESANSAFRAWRISFDQIVAQKPLTADLLYLMAMFDRQSIPRWLLKIDGVAISLGTLQAFHMVTARAERGTFTLHRLTQVFVQAHLRNIGKLQHWKDLSLSILSSSYPTEIGVLEWPTCEALAPHVQYMTKDVPSSPTARLDLANLLCWAADFDIERGLFAEALAGAKRSLELYKTLVSDKDQKFAAAEWLFGRLLFYQAKSAEDIRAAEAHLQHALKISVQPSLVYAESAFELAYLYYSDDREAESLKMAKESFESWERIGGSSSVRTLDNRHDYAIQLAMFGHEKEAIANWKEIIRLTPQSDAVENTKFVFFNRSSACIAEFQSDFQVAEDLNARLAALCAAIYNPTHVHVLDYRLIQAEQIMRQGRYQEALQIVKTVLALCQNKSEWLIAISCLQVQAECNRLTGQLEEELKLRYECLGILQQKLGTEHNDTIDALEALARCLILLHKWQDAARISEKVLEARLSKLELNNPGVLTAMHLVAICKIQDGDSPAAEGLLADISERNQRGLDISFIETMCNSLWNQSKWKDLIAWCHKGLEMDKATPSKFQNVLAAATRKDEKPVEALASQVASINIEQDVGMGDFNLEAQLPPFEFAQRRRFGRVIHPRSWST